MVGKTCKRRYCIVTRMALPFPRSLIRRLPLLLLPLVCACVSAPTQEMADARIALRSAEQAGAREYAGILLERAKRALTMAEAQLESGLYGAAQANARRAAEAALTARQIAEEIGLAKQEAEALRQFDLETREVTEAMAEALSAGAKGQRDKAIRAAQRAAEAARGRLNEYYLARARSQRAACTQATSADLVRADREIARKRGAAALEILQAICPATPAQ